MRSGESTLRWEEEEEGMLFLGKEAPHTSISVKVHPEWWARCPKEEEVLISSSVFAFVWLGLLK